MGTPTEAQAILQFRDEIRLRSSLRTALTVTFPTNVDTAQDNLKTDVGAEKETGWREMKVQLAAAWLNATSLNAHILDWVALADKPINLPLQESIDVMMGFFRDNGLFVVSRGFTPTAPVADVGNIGTGAQIRIFIDRFGDTIETGVGADTYTSRCIFDANTGTERSEETFEIRSGTQDPTGLEAKGAGVSVPVNSVHSDGSLMDNAGFDQFGSDPAAPTAITAWDTSIVLAGDGSDVAGDAVNIYLPKKRASENRFALRVKTTITLTQRFDRGGATVNQIGPLFAALYVDAATFGASGSISLAVGSKTVTIADLTTLGAGYNELRALVTAAEDAWYKNFAADPLSVVITIVIIAGELLIDDLIMFETFFISDSWYGSIPAQTPFRAGTESGADGDLFTWATTATELGINQREFALRTGRYLPTTGTTPIAAP